MGLFQGKGTPLFGLCLLLTTTCSSAKNMEVSAAGGVNWYNVPTSFLVISAYETDNDRINQTPANGAWKVGIGTHLFAEKLQNQSYVDYLLGELNVYQTFTTLRGVVWQDQLEEFNNYNFKLPIQSTRVMLDVKPTFSQWKKISPYLIFGVGANWNNLSYQETVNGPEIDTDSALSLASQTAFQVAWDVGAGFSIDVTNNLSATAEYIYAFLGNAFPADGPTNDVSLLSVPRFSLDAQTLLFGLRLKF